MPRPRSPLLDRDRIADAAMDLVDRRGDFTVVELAKALKVTASSLYHHVAGREDVVDLIRERVGAEIDTTGLGALPWAEAMERMARSYRLAFARRPGAVRLLATSPVRDVASLGAYDRMAEVLLDAGFPEAVVLPVIAALDNFLLGAALDLAATDQMYEPDPESQPSLARVTAAAAAAGPRLSDLSFETGLAALLSGFRALLDDAVPGGRSASRRGSGSAGTAQTPVRRRAR